MIFYALAFSLPFLFYPLRDRSRLLYVFLLTSGWVIFAALRLDIGGSDLFKYSEFYTSIDPKHFPASNNWEPLFKGLAFVTRIMGLSFNGFLGIVAIIGILPAVYVIDKRSGDTPIGLFVYGIQWMLYGTFVILRQGLALGMAFLALDALLDRKWLRFALATLFAIGFHYSALCILLLPLFTKEMGPKLRTGLWIAVGIAFIAIEAGNTSNFFGIFHDQFFYRLSEYLLQGYREPLNLLNVVEVLGLTFLIQRYAPRSPALLRNGYFLYMLFIVLSLEHSVIQRMGRYEEICMALLIPAIVNPKEDRSRERMLVSMVLVLYFLAKIGRWILMNADGPGGFLPYRTILWRG